jgi:hypothetical protein
MSHLPIQDFRPYKVGVDIKAQMELPEGAKKDSIVTLLYYKKNGVVKEFTESNYPWEDSTWVWVDTKSTVVKEGDRAPIHNFSISDEDGNDIVPEILANPGFKLLLISYKIEKADDIGLKESVNLHKWCDENKVLFYAVSSSLKSEVELKDKMFGLNYPFYTADEITLKTIIRSNPGFVLLKGSVIVAKWHYNDVPTETEFMSYLK